VSAAEPSGASALIVASTMWLAPDRDGASLTVDSRLLGAPTSVRPDQISL